MINILADKHHREHAGRDRKRRRKGVQENMPEECMVDFFIIILLSKKEGWNSHRTGTDQRHLYRFKGVCLSKKIVRRESITENMVLIRNMEAAVRILFTTRRP